MPPILGPLLNQFFFHFPFSPPTTLVPYIPLPQIQISSVYHDKRLYFTITKNFKAFILILPRFRFPISSLEIPPLPARNHHTRLQDLSCCRGSSSCSPRANRHPSSVLHSLLVLQQHPATTRSLKSWCNGGLISSQEQQNQ